MRYGIKNFVTFIQLFFKSCLYLGLIFGSTFLIGCVADNNNSQDVNSQYTKLVIASESQVSISQIGVIPADSTNSNNYILADVHNVSTTPIYLQGVMIEQNNSKLIGKSTSKYTDASKCYHLEAQSKCQVKVFVGSYGSYLLHLFYRTDSGIVYDVTQLIRQDIHLPEYRGFAYAENTFSVTDFPDTNISIPFKLTDNLSSVKVFVNNLPVHHICSDNKLTKGTLCTALINADNLNYFDNNHIKFVGSLSDGKLTTSNSILSISNNNSANLITSAVNISVNPDDGTAPVQVFVKNNGNATANNILINGITPIMIESNTCGTNLISGQTCSFNVNVRNSIASGQSSAFIQYNNISGTQVVYFNVAYVSPYPSPALVLTTSGSFTNKIVNTGSSYYYVNVSNTGNVKFTNLQFTNINSQNISMSNTTLPTTSNCIAGQSLSVGASCTLVLSYNPTIAESTNTVNLVVSTDFSGLSVQPTSYTSSVTISYSAITTPSFVALGDLGTVITSPSGGLGIWSAQVNSPFSSSLIGANGITFNGTNTYAVILTNGEVKYSLLNGLFWLSAASTNISSSTCGILYDGTRYFTCGTTASTVLPSPCNQSNRACIIYTSNLSASWQVPTNGLIPGTLTVANKIYYISGSGYVVTSTPGGTGANRAGIYVSTTGTGVWNARGNDNSAQAFYSLVWNNTYLDAWRSDSAFDRTNWTNIPAINSANWNVDNNGISPAIPARVNASLFQATDNNSYIIALQNGNLLTSSNSTFPTSQPFVSRTTNSTQLNGLAYAESPGAYIAVGNNGTNLTATTTANQNWTSNQPLTVGQATQPNLLSAAYIGNTTWATGVSTLLQSNSLTSWQIPGITGIAKAGNNYLAVDNQGHIYSSTNLSSWSQIYDVSIKLNAITCPSTNNCIAVGNSGTIVVTNNGGSSWSVSIISPSTTADLKGVLCQGGTCVAVGGSGLPNSGTVLSSNVPPYNGTWTRNTNALAATIINGISYVNASYVIVGNNNGSGNAYIATSNSPSGTWTSRISATGNSLNGISCTSSIVCVAVGNNGIALYSNDGGINWSVSSVTTTINDILSVYGLQKRFVAVGKNSTIIISNDGDIWTPASFPTSSSSLTNLSTVTIQ